MYAGHEFLLSFISSYTYMNFTFVSHLEERERERETDREGEREKTGLIFLYIEYIFICQ